MVNFEFRMAKFPVGNLLWLLLKRVRGTRPESIPGKYVFRFAAVCVRFDFLDGRVVIGANGCLQPRKRDVIRPVSTQINSLQPESTVDLGLGRVD
jgi:hypothetical protein